MSEEIKKQVFALMAHAEAQQEALDKAMETINKQQAEMERVQKSLPSLINQSFNQSIERSRKLVESDLNSHATNVAKELKEATKGANMATQAIKGQAELLGWKYALITVGSVICMSFLVVLASLTWIPSFDDIAERRTTITMLNDSGGALDTSKCGGELCVRVMTKKCGFGDAKDYCVADLKD